MDGWLGDVRDEIGGEVRDEGESDGRDDVPDNALGRSLRARVDDGEGCDNDECASGFTGTQLHRK